MLVDFINKIRKKPEHTRIFFIWATTIAIMSIIVVLWLNFGIKPYARFKKADKTSSQHIETDINKLDHFFRDARNDFIYLKGSLSQALGDLFSGKNEPKEIPPELRQEFLGTTSPAAVPLQLPNTE